MVRRNKEDPTYRVAPDGPGWGVQRYYDVYDEWIFVNEEPFVSRAEARQYLEGIEEDGEDRDWEEDREQWSRGLLQNLDP
jgi:hypothetical protein